jgi:adenosine deaminase
MPVKRGLLTTVKQGLHLLKVDRIDHGNAALDDPETMHYLAQTQIPLTLCPLSNLFLKVVPKLEQHPLKKMLQAGLLVSVNSHDPTYFGGYLAHNRQACQQALDLSRSELVQLAKNSFQSAFLPADQKKHYVVAVDEFVQHWPDRSGFWP